MKEVIDNILVLKVGTNTLIRKDVNGSERLDKSSFERIGRQVLALQEKGQSVIIVSSAAITAGMIVAGLGSRPRKNNEMIELQRLASIGWRHILNAWDSALGGKNIGELLLTRRELGMKSEREEVLQVTHTLLKHGDVVIVNENDAISHEEIAFGDNDTLAATFAAGIASSCLFGSNIGLVLLSDIDGVYADLSDSSSVIPHIDDISHYSHLAKGTSQVNGTGGMTSKFQAANIAVNNGVDMWIANGRAANAIARTINGEIGTHFVSNM